MTYLRDWFQQVKKLIQAGKGIASLEGCLYMPSAQNNHTHQKTFCGVATSLQDSKPKTNLRQL